MRRALWMLGVLAACWGQNAYIVEGVVVEVPSETRVILDHEEIPGFMAPMVMPFEVRDASLLEGVRPGDRVIARLMVEEDRSFLDAVRVSGRGMVSAPKAVPADDAPMPIVPGAAFPRVELVTSAGEELVLGAGQRRPIAMTFLYTTCPIPEACPAIVTRLQGLQAAVEDQEIDIIAVTLTPDSDTVEVLQAFAGQVGAKEGMWHFVRTSKEQLSTLAMFSGLAIMRQSDVLVHGNRLMVLGGDGTLVERYDDNRWPLDRVVSQLRTGEPLAPPGIMGSVYPRE